MSTFSPRTSGRYFAKAPSSEYLVKNKYAAADKLTINGGSNGGMSMGLVLVWVRSGMIPPLQVCLWLRVLTVLLRELSVLASLKLGFWTCSRY